MDEPMTYPSATGMVSGQHVSQIGRLAIIRLTSNTISTVDNNTGQVSLMHFTARPRGCERQDGLYGDVAAKVTNERGMPRELQR